MLPVESTLNYADAQPIRIGDAVLDYEKRRRPDRYFVG